MAGQCTVSCMLQLSTIVKGNIDWKFDSISCGIVIVMCRSLQMRFLTQPASRYFTTSTVVALQTRWGVKKYDAGVTGTMVAERNVNL